MCCVGDGRGRVGETLGRKPSRFPPKTEALAERSCRTAVLSGTAVQRRTHPYTTKPSLGAPPLSPAPWEAGRAPTPWAGTPFIPPVACPAGITSRGSLCSQCRPRMRSLRAVSAVSAAGKLGSAGRPGRPLHPPHVGKDHAGLTSAAVANVKLVSAARAFTSCFLVSRRVAPGQPGRPLHPPMARVAVRPRRGVGHVSQPSQ